MAMTSSVIDLVGIERALAYSDQSVFDQIILPSGIDKETLKDAIILRAGSFELLYSDPIMLTVGIRIWSKKMYPTFDKWIKALNKDYNPIENYNRVEESTIDHTGSGKTNNKTNSAGSNNSTSKNEVDETNTDKVTGYDSSDFENKEQNIIDNETNTEGHSNYNDNSTSEGSSSDQYKDKTSSHISGNIGVTTSQQMLESELKLRGEYNIYDMITDLFISEFCIMTY